MEQGIDREGREAMEVVRTLMLEQWELARQAILNGELEGYVLIGFGGQCFASHGGMIDIREVVEAMEATLVKLHAAEKFDIPLSEKH